MGDIEAHIERLEPMRVASFHAISQTPEHDAWERLRAWAGPKGLLADLETNPVFGFNNPNPSPDRAEYGYELWLGIGPQITPPAGSEAKEYPGGLYAVTTCRLRGEPDIGTAWRLLWDWARANHHKWRKTHELERVRAGTTEDDMVVDLYLPIEE